MQQIIYERGVVPEGLSRNGQGKIGVRLAERPEIRGRAAAKADLVDDEKAWKVEDLID